MNIIQPFCQAVAVVAALALWHASLSAQEVNSTVHSGRDPKAVTAIETAMKLMREQRYRDAVVEVNKALKIDSTFAEAIVLKGNILRATKDYQGAAKAYSDALNFSPESPEAVEAYNGRGEAYMAIGQFDIAIDDFRKAQELDPNNAVVLSNLGHLLVNKAGDATNGLRILSDAIAINGEDARAYRDRGLARAQLRDFREAIADMQKAAEIDPDDSAEDRSALPSLPAIEEGEIKVFRLQNADAVKTAETVGSLFGVSQLRVAVDDRTNSLVVFGKQDPLKVVEAVMLKLDQEPAKSKTTVEFPAAERSPRSVMVRLFWLADGANSGESAESYLPGKVVNGVVKLGLGSPRVVSQSVNSISDGASERFDFATLVPAIIGEQQVDLHVRGAAKWLGEDRIGLDLKLATTGNVQCELDGSLAMPLNHYMVLGASNSAIMERRTVTKNSAAGAEFVEEQISGKPQDARFAFVVQVVEAESYEAERASSTERGSTGRTK